MSRSYKKFPLFRDVLWGKSMKKGRQCSNRKIRRKLKNSNIDVGNGRDYKRFGLDKWDLYEYKHHQTLDDVIAEYESRQKGLVNGRHSYRKCEPTLEEEINWWKSSYVRK